MEETPPSRTLTLEVPFHPPTDNKIRQIVHFGMKKAIGWTTKAKNFKKDFKTYLWENYKVELVSFSTSHVPNQDVYSVTVIIGMQCLNSTYKPGSKSGAQNRYKQVDVGNRRKLLEDALSESLGIDDSLFFVFSMMKVQSEEPWIRVHIDTVDPSHFGV